MNARPLPAALITKDPDIMLPAIFYHPYHIPGRMLRQKIRHLVPKPEITASIRTHPNPLP